MPMGIRGGKWDTVGVLGILRLCDCEWNFIIILSVCLCGRVEFIGCIGVVFTHYRVLEGHTEGLGYTMRE